MATAICESFEDTGWSCSWNSDYAICRLTAQVRHCPPASATSWPGSVRKPYPQACCMCWMNCLSDASGECGWDWADDARRWLTALVVVVDHDTRKSLPLRWIIGGDKLTAGAEGVA